MKTVYAPTTPHSRSAVVAIALAAAAGGVLLTALIHAVTGTFSFSVSILAVILAAWYGDLAAGLLATTVIVVITPLFVPALTTWSHETPDNLVRLLAQALVSIIVTVLVSRLRAAERRYRLIVETAAEGIWTVGADGRTTFVNTRMAELLGYRPCELIGRPFAAFVHASSVAKAEQGFVALRTGTRQFDECELVRKDGGSQWVMYSATPILDGDTFRGALAMVADISDRKRAEAVIRQQADELALANRAKDEFFASLSHELRTPLNAILGSTEMLLTMNVDAETRQRVLERINRAARAESALVQDLLDVSRIIGGKFRLELQEVDLAAVTHAAIDVVKPAADAKRIALQVDAQGPTLLLGDSNRLQQIVWNLLSNSIKFTPSGGRIDVVVKRVDSMLEVVVRDTGIGIPGDFLPHVFDRFQQHHSGTTPTHTGLGLGLAIVRHLAELHGGTVRAASDGADRGATFTVSLPVRHSIGRPAPGTIGVSMAYAESASPASP